MDPDHLGQVSGVKIAYLKLKKIIRAVLFIHLLAYYLLKARFFEKVSIKRPVLSFISNSRSLERTGLIIETLEYCIRWSL